PTFYPVTEEPTLAVARKRLRKALTRELLVASRRPAATRLRFGSSPLAGQSAKSAARRHLSWDGAGSLLVEPQYLSVSRTFQCGRFWDPHLLPTVHLTPCTCQAHPELPRALPKHAESG